MLRSPEATPSRTSALTFDAEAMRTKIPCSVHWGGESEPRPDYPFPFSVQLCTKEQNFKPSIGGEYAVD